MNDKNSGILTKISIEARTEVIKELFTDVAVLFDKSEEKVEKLVEVLQQQKDAVGHGNWLKYISENFGGDPAIRRIQYFMRKPASSNNPLLDYLESEQPTAPRSERKPADVVVTTPQDHIVDTDEKVDDDATPDPPTQRKIAKGSEKVPEDKKPRTQQVPVEIIEADEPAAPFVTDPLEHMTFGEILAVAVSKLADDQKKKAAKELRKHADRLDPPDETKAAKIPTVSELKSLIDRDELSDQMLAAVTDWVAYKQKHPDKKYRYQSGESFTRDQKRMAKVYMQTGEPFVLEAIDTAIAKGWRGWEQDSTSNGKANGNGHSTAHRGTGKRRPTVEEVFG